jgi:hypothetical protein
VFFKLNTNMTSLIYVYYLYGIVMNCAKIQGSPLCHMYINVIHTGDEVAESIG